MRLTSKQQAMLTTAIDQYIFNTDIAVTRTADMWDKLYDDVVGAEIEDEHHEIKSEDYEVVSEKLDYWAEEEAKRREAYIRAASTQLDLEDAIERIQGIKVDVDAEAKADMRGYDL